MGSGVTGSPRERSKEIACYGREGSLGWLLRALGVVGLYEHLAGPRDEQLVVGFGQALDTADQGWVGSPRMDTPFGVGAFHRRLGVFGLELGCHGRRKEAASRGLEGIGRDDPDNLHWEMVHDVDDAPRERESFLLVGGFKPGHLGLEIGERGGDVGRGVRVH